VTYSAGYKKLLLIHHSLKNYYLSTLGETKPPL